jgi:hypothetical protein
MARNALNATKESAAAVLCTSTIPSPTGLVQLWEIMQSRMAM